jgi:hypothetical protein
LMSPDGVKPGSEVRIDSTVERKEPPVYVCLTELRHQDLYIYGLASE